MQEPRDSYKWRKMEFQITAPHACQPGDSRVYRTRSEDLDAFLARRARTRTEATPNVEEQVARILDRVRTKAMNTAE